MGVLILCLFGSVLAVGARHYLIRNTPKEEVPPAVEVQEVIRIVPPVATAPTEPKETSLPSSINLKVPFYSQAPFENWDYPWQEACEEASVLLVANIYFNHDWMREQFNEEILKMVEWEKGQFGTYLDTTAAQTAQILKDYLGLESITHTDPTLEDVQKILSKGHLVLMFFAGKELHNPNYRNGGPPYHVFVVKGYKPGGRIITNDVGTRKGADYVYSWDTLQRAMHDFAQPIESGAKKMLEVLPPAQS